MKRCLMMFAVILFAVSLLGSPWLTLPAAVTVVRAQPKDAKLVEIMGAEGLVIKGNYFAPTGDVPAPAILLLHQNGSSKQEWNDVAAALVAQGYAALAIDQRGFGETKGNVNWKLAEQDVQLMFAWMRQQQSIDPARVAVMGGSIGSVMALRSCAADERCKAVIALSPGLNYFGVPTMDQVEVLSGEGKAVFLVAGQRDFDAVNAVRALTAAWVTGDLTVRFYPNAFHGVSLVKYQNDLLPMIVTWLAVYN